MPPLPAKPAAAVRLGATAAGYSQREALDLASDLGWPEPAVYPVAPGAPRGLLAEMLRGADLSTAAGRLVVQLQWETRLHEARRRAAMRAHGSGRPTPDMQDGKLLDLVCAIGARGVVALMIQGLGQVSADAADVEALKALCERCGVGIYSPVSGSQSVP